MQHPYKEAVAKSSSKIWESHSENGDRTKRRTAVGRTLRARTEQTVRRVPAVVCVRVGAMYFMARLAEHGEFIPADAEWKWGCFLASVSLALSVAGNFTNVVPAACLALAFSGVALGGLRPLLIIADQRIQPFAKYFLLPGATTGFCLLWP